MLNLSKLSEYESRSISAENFKGEKGKGGMAVEGTGQNAARDLGRGWKVSPSVVIPAGETFEMANIDGSGIIKHIWITDNCPENRRLIIRMYWDGSETPSVEVPMGDFFASAEHQNYAQLTSLPVCVNPKRAFNCYWDMPFYKNCRITVENQHSDNVTMYYQVDYVMGDVPEGCGYFHAQFRRVNPLTYKECYTILDNVEGRGHYVGTYLFWGVNNNGWWGEGEIKFYMDGDKDYPTICGTGTEDYFCGSWNFDIGGKYQEFCTPYAGLSKVIRPDGLYSSQQRFSMYRWHICDPIHFKKDLKVTIQALGWRSEKRYLPLQDDISSVAFWYQDSICKKFPKLPSRDELEIR
ncbi:MAG: glycoside hydrolase family 172 protein [Clostridia bacterium]|nr:glycoside hydrolase family 172 protein [Clostridia bacterium]